MSDCQSYERKPLDPAGTFDAWLARSPSDESARQFAERLAIAEGRTPGAFNPSDGLTLIEAEPVALIYNRQLRLARLEANVSRASSEYAGLWEDPVGGVELERILSSVPNPWIVAATIGITIPISGRLEAEKALAGAAYAATLQELAAKEWATRAALREMWLEWSAQVIRAALAADLVGSLRPVTALVKSQEEAGTLSRIDARLFVVELAGREADSIAEAARAEELELQLRDLMGLAPEAPIQLVPSLGFPARATDIETLRSALVTTNMELAAVRSAYEVAENELALEIREQYPDLTIGPGYKSEDDQSRALLGLSMPIPIWNRNQQGVAEATASREVARARFETTYEHLASQVAIALTRYRAGKSVREALESRVVPLADEQNAEVRRVAELGRVDPLLLREAILAQHSAKVRLTDAKAVESIGAVRLDELIGPPVITVPTATETPATERSSEGATP